MKYIKALFDIQKVHVDGSKVYYEVYYLQGRSFTKIIDNQFTWNEAKDYINKLVNSED